jgi:hypothetical protein
VSRALLATLAVVGLFAGCLGGGALTGPPADPPADRRGWEAGYWAHEDLAVDASDGLDAGEREALVARTMARVERVRDVEFRDPVPLAVIDRETYRRQRRAADDADPRYRQVRYEALFLVGDDGDPGAAHERTYGSAVRAYYDVGEDRVVVVGDPAEVDETVLAQELFHAYQFRNLVPVFGAVTATSDERAGLLSVLEGDAGLVQERYRERCERDWDCHRGAETEGPDRGDVHLGVYALGYFPYVEGETYVEGVRRRAGWDGVNDLYGAIPDSSEQVLEGPHEAVPNVEVPDRSGPEWERVERPAGADFVEFGAAGVATMFSYTAYDDRAGTAGVGPAVDGEGPPEYDLPASDGWDGDRLYPYRGPGGTGYVWRLGWDSPAEAREFVAAYRELLAYHGGHAVDRRGERVLVPDGSFADAYRVDRTGATVTVVNAPTLAALSAVHAPRTRGHRSDRPDPLGVGR